MPLDLNKVLLKISGEILSGDKANAFDINVLLKIAHEIKSIHDMGIKIAIVIGGGNIIRGINHKDLNLSKNDADAMGMMATVINGLYLKNTLHNIGLKTILYSSFSISGIVEDFFYEDAKKNLNDGNIVVLVGGTGNPYFTTDTCAVLRALELNCDAVLKGTKVNGIYNKDPKKYIDAEKFQNLSYNYIIKNNLKVMDMASIAIAEENNLPVIVFSIMEKDSMQKIIKNEGDFTLVCNREEGN
jgi:uridylate kinase